MPYHPLPRLHKPNYLLDHEQHSYQSHHRTRAKTLFYKPHDIPVVSAALRKIMDREDPPSPYSQPTTTANPPTLTSCAPIPLTHCSLPNTTLATQTKSKLQKPSAHTTENSYIPTIMPLTFSLFLQLAVIQKLHIATMDINPAYLNAALPPDADWIVTTLEPHIAEVCGLDPAQEYRIANALYGLPDSGRLFYQYYKAAQLAEGYRMSAFDNCLFYRTTATEINYTSTTHSSLATLWRTSTR